MFYQKKFSKLNFPFFVGQLFRLLSFIFLDLIVLWSPPFSSVPQGLFLESRKSENSRLRHFFSPPSSFLLQVDVDVVIEARGRRVSLFFLLPALSEVSCPPHLPVSQPKPRRRGGEKHALKIEKWLTCFLPFSSSAF